MPAWFFFALLCSLGSAGATLVGKKTLLHERPIEFSTIFSVLIFLCSLPLLYWADLSRLDGLWLVLFVGSWFGTTGFLLVISTILAGRVFKEKDIKRKIAYAVLMVVGASLVITR